MNLKPLSDRIVVKPLEAEGEDRQRHRFTRYGKGKKPQEGEVMAVGPGQGFLENGTRPGDGTGKSGDKIIYSRYAGTEIKIKGVEYLILRQDDVLALVQ